MNKKKKDSYNLQLALTFFMVIVFMGIILTKMYTMAKNNAISEGQNCVMQTAQTMNFNLARQYDIMQNIAGDIQGMIYKEDGVKHIRDYIKNNKENYLKQEDDNYFRCIYGVFGDTYINKNQKSSNAIYKVFETEWYSAAASSNGEIVFSSPYLDEETNSVMITVSYMMSDKHSVIAAEFPVDDVQEHIDNISMNHSGQIMLLDNKGFVIAHSDKTQIGKNYLTEKIGYTGMLAREVIDRSSEFDKSEFTLEYRKEGHYVFAEKTTNKWNAVVSMKTTELYASLKNILVLAVTSTLAAIVLICIVFRSVNKRRREAENLNSQLEGIANIYISVHVLDFYKNSIEEVRAMPYVTEMINKAPKGLCETLYFVMQSLTSEQSWATVREFIDISTLNERMKDTNVISHEFIGKHGWARAYFVVHERSGEGKITKALWMVESIDEEKRKENELRYLSETDLMTGIRNRGSGEQKIVELIAKGKEGMFCLLDADKFKSINDNFGHGVGDKVIIAIADCLRESFRERDIVMRLGGDEFAVYAVGITDEELGRSVVERFFHAIDNIQIAEIGERKIEVSMGAAFFRNESGEDFESIYRRADSGTYRSKKISGSYVTFVN